MMFLKDRNKKFSNFVNILSDIIYIENKVSTGSNPT